MSWNPSEHYQKIAEANRVFFDTNAESYDKTETCVADAKAQAELEQQLDRVLEAASKPASELRALDACGGSGNIALKLLRRGVRVTLVDISTGIESIFKGKCDELGVEAEAVCSEIGAFLASDPEPFDLIVFCSALHHLEDIDGVLNLAFERLAPGGLLFSMFDPTSNANFSPVSRVAQRLEYYCFKFFCQTADVPKAAARKWKRLVSGARAGDKEQMDLDTSTAGVLAEYHVERGIDDLALVERMKETGYEVVFHDRYVGSRYALTAAVVRKMGDVTSFKLLLRRPDMP